jgi:hypothetical protein
VQARTTIVPLKRGEHVPRVHGCQHPKPTFTFSLHNVRSTDQVAIAKTPILVFSVVTKNYAYASASLDERSTEIRRYRLIKALCLGLCDSREIEICMALSVEF